MIQALREFYGLQPPPPADLFQFVVWEILSEQALPARRDLAWQALRRIPALTPDAMSRAPSNELRDAVGIAGPHRDEKIDRLQATVGEFRRHRDELDRDQLRRGSSLSAGRALKRLAHLHPSIRARAHLFVLDARVLPIDADIHRVVGRLIDEDQHRTRGVSRRWLAERLAPDLAAWRDAVVYLRHHAQHICVQVAPHCGVCPLRPQCAFALNSVKPLDA